MNKCDCWHKEERIVGWCGFSPLTKTVYECYGTKEREECQCMGDSGKCDFYPEVREKAQKDSECEYCKDTSQKPFDVIFIGKFGEYNYDLCVEDFNIKFCPMCGRDLKNEG